MFSGVTDDRFRASHEPALAAGGRDSPERERAVASRPWGRGQARRHAGHSRGRAARPGIHAVIAAAPATAASAPFGALGGTGLRHRRRNCPDRDECGGPAFGAAVWLRRPRRRGSGSRTGRAAHAAAAPEGGRRVRNAPTRSRGPQRRAPAHATPPLPARRCRRSRRGHQSAKVRSRRGPGGVAGHAVRAPHRRSRIPRPAPSFR
jgi:hypothetical protein